MTTPLQQIVNIICDEKRVAIVWTALMQAATKSPSSLGVAVKELLWARPILEESDTRVAAAQLMSVLFPLLNDADRRRTEEAILALGQTDDPDDAKYKERMRDAYIALLPAALMCHPDVIELRKDIDSRDETPQVAPDVEFSGMRMIDEEEGLRDRGVDLVDRQNVRARKLLKTIRNYKGADKGEGSRLQDAETAMDAIRHMENILAPSNSDSVDLRAIPYAQEYIYACCAELARWPELHEHPELVQEVTNRLLVAADNDNPTLGDDDADRWDNGHSHWSSPSPRIDAAEGLLRLAAIEATKTEDVLRSVRKLAQDPVTSVRHQISANVHMLWHSDRALMWELIDWIAANEQRLVAIDFFVRRVLLNMPPQESDKVDSLFESIYRRIETRENSEDIRGAYATHCLRRGLWHGSSSHTSLLHVWADDPLSHLPEAGSLIGHCRELLRADSDDLTADERNRGRVFGVDLLVRMTQALFQRSSQLHSEEPQNYGEWGEKSLEALRSIHKLVHTIATETYFGSGAHDDKRAADASPQDLASIKVFLADAAPLIDVVCECPFVEAAYDLLKTFEYLIFGDPKRGILCVSKLIKAASADAIQHEAMAADLTVKITERFLAENRLLVSTSSEVQAAILDILDIFIDAGWPQAAALTYRLDDLFR